MNHFKPKALDLNFSSFLIDSLNRINKYKKTEDNFLIHFSKAQDNLDELINDHPFFTDELPEDRAKRLLKKNNFLTSLGKKKNKKHIEHLTGKQHTEIKHQFLEIPKTQTKKKNTHSRTQLFHVNGGRNSILSKNDVDFVSQLAKVNGEEEIVQNEDKSKIPLVLRIKDHELKTLMIENKNTKDNKRKGAMVSSQEQVNAFLDALHQRSSSNQNENEKEFESNAIINKFLKQNSTLRNIYSKCINQIRNGEEIDKYIDYVKRKEELQIKAQNKNYISRLKKMEDQMVIANIEGKKKKNLIHVLIGNQPIYLEGNIRDKKTSFQNQVERIDVIPKISENLAFTNRNSYLSKFNYDYSDDNDFLFRKEYCRIKGIDENGEENNVIDGFGKKQDNHHKKRNCVSDEIEFILDMTEKEKNLLIRRIKEDQIKYEQEKNQNKCLSGSNSKVNYNFRDSKGTLKCIGKKVITGNKI